MKKLSGNKKEKGQGLVEYALILVLVAIVVIGAMTLLGPTIKHEFYRVSAVLHTTQESCEAAGFSWALDGGCVTLDDMPPS